MAVLVRTNAQLPGARGRVRARPGSRSTFEASGSSRDPRSGARCASPSAPGPPAESDAALGRAGRLATAFERELGVRRDAVPEGETAAARHARGRHAARAGRRAGPRPTRSADIPAFLAEIERRTAVEAGGEAAGVELLTYHRAKGLEWDAVFLPALEEGTLPIRQSTEPGRAGRGAPAAVRRDHPGAALPVAVVGDQPDSGRRGREGRRSRSRFLDGLVPGLHATAGRLVAVGPGARSRASEPPRSIRPTARRCPTRSVPGARPVPGPTAVAPFIVFHDSTIEAIAARRPRSIAELRRVPGIGPMKLDRYGEEIISVVVGES